MVKYIKYLPQNKKYLKINENFGNANRTDNTEMVNTDVKSEAQVQSWLRNAQIEQDAEEDRSGQTCQTIKPYRGDWRQATIYCIAL